MSQLLKFLPIFAILVTGAFSYCPVPECTQSTATQSDEPLYAHTDPYKFWQCAPSSEGLLWKPVEKQCAAEGLVFSEQRQQCVWVFEWDRTCQSNPTSTTWAPEPTSSSTRRPQPSSTTDRTSTFTWVPTSSTTQGSTSLRPSSTTPGSTAAPVDCCTPLDCRASNIAKLPACPQLSVNYREYYRECVNGEPVARHCPHKPEGEQLLFNYYIQSCVHPKVFEESC